MATSPGLVPAAKLTDISRFLSVNGTWEDPSIYLKFLSEYGWILGNQEDLFLRGDGLWAKMDIEDENDQENEGIFVYYYNGDTLHFSNVKIEEHGDNHVLQEFYLNKDSNIFVADQVPWRNYANNIKTITSEDNFIPSLGIGYWFYNFYNLTNIQDLSKWDTSNVVSFYNTFGYCAKMEDWSWIANWKTDSLLFLIGTFAGCISLNDLSFLRHWNISNVIAMTHIFEQATFTDLTPISFWDVSSVINFGSVFKECLNIKDLTPIAEWQTVKCIYLDYVFYGCTNIQDFSVLNNWNVEKCTNHANAFKNTNGQRPSWGINW